ncbi:carbohydrate esterase family 4 protein [Mycena amicta]|nr:carbohydrate esterase family 4 protein [Mycena amicta]
MLGSLTLLSIPLLSVSAAVIHGRHPHDHSHSHNVARLLPGQWFHRDDHPVHALFKRGTGGSTDGVEYAVVGSPEWAAAYPPPPPTRPDPTAMPAEWLSALNDAVSRGAIPKIPVSTNPGTDIPTYGDGFDPNGPTVCSATYGCRIPEDVWDAPDGHIAISFDDGPLPPTDTLLTFLDAQTPPQPVTHFMIGSNIIQQAAQFTRAFERGDDLAVHTWTHPMMTTLSNEAVVAELGWTMEVIHNSTGGRVPRFWRPPQGDSDTRTSAIAREVFGLTTVIWNRDTSDWSLDATPPGTTIDKVNASLQEWITGPKSPGLIILEHELSEESVGTFKAAYPVMQANGWTLGSLATVMGNGTAYQNAASDSSDVVRVANVADAKALSGGVSSATSASAAGAGAGAGTSGTPTVTDASQTTADSTSTSSAPDASNSNAASSLRSSTSAFTLGALGLLMLWS